MPKIVVPEGGAEYLLSWLLKPASSTFAQLTLGLFVNDYTPVWDSELTDFVEASGSWYSSETVDPDTWAVAPGDDSNVYGTYDTEFQWTSDTGTGTVFGYFLYEPNTGQLIWCQRFDTPITLQVGREIKIRPKLALWSRCIPICTGE